MVPISEIIIAVVTAIILTPFGLFLRLVLSRTRYLDDKLETYKKETDVKVDNIKNEIYKYYLGRKEFTEKIKEFEKKVDKVDTKLESHFARLFQLLLEKK